MPSLYRIVDQMLESHNDRILTLPEATHGYLLKIASKLKVPCPEITLTEATIVEVLWKTYMERK